MKRVIYSGNMVSNNPRKMATLTDPYAWPWMDAKPEWFQRWFRRVAWVGIWTLLLVSAAGVAYFWHPLVVPMLLILVLSRRT